MRAQRSSAAYSAVDVDATSRTRVRVDVYVRLQICMRTRARLGLAEMATQHTAGGTRSAGEVFTFTDYDENKRGEQFVSSEPFYSHHGYKLRLGISYLSSGMKIILLRQDGEYDDQLQWPMKARFRLELLNQARDHHHLVRLVESENWGAETILTITNSELETNGDGIRYVMDDCIKFKVCVTAL